MPFILHEPNATRWTPRDVLCALEKTWGGSTAAPLCRIRYGQRAHALHVCKRLRVASRLRRSAAPGVGQGLALRACMRQQPGAASQLRRSAAPGAHTVRVCGKVTWGGITALPLCRTQYGQRACALRICKQLGAASRLRCSAAPSVGQGLVLHAHVGQRPGAVLRLRRSAAPSACASHM
jgi:hypothetical protein